MHFLHHYNNHLYYVKHCMTWSIFKSEASYTCDQNRNKLMLAQNKHLPKRKKKKKKKKSIWLLLLLILIL